METDPKIETPPETERADSSTEEANTDWHRIAGTLFSHCVENHPYEVDVDFDVARTEKRIDILIVKKAEDANPPVIADGFDNLQTHNLITFKSFQESMSVHALEELICYFKLYQTSERASDERRIDPDQIRLIALATRYPRKMMKRKWIGKKKIKNGVWDLMYGGTPIRLIVIQKLKLEKQNANILLFSSKKAQVQYGKANHSLGDSRYLGLMSKLFIRFSLGGLDMGKLYDWSWEGVSKDIRENEQLLQGFLSGLGAEKVTKFLPPKEVLNQYTPEQRLQDVPVEDRLKGLSEAEIEKLIQAHAEKKKQASENTDS